MCGGGEGGREKKKKKEEGVRPLQPLRSPDGGLSKHHNTGAGGSGGGRGGERGRKKERCGRGQQMRANADPDMMGWVMRAAIFSSVVGGGRGEGRGDGREQR